MAGSSSARSLKQAILQLASGNLMATGLMFILVIGLPKVISFDAYGLWQLYLLYTTYLYYMTFGIPEGIFLRFSGKGIEHHHRRHIRAHVGALAIVELFAQAIVLATLWVLLDEKRAQVVALACTATVFYVVRSAVTSLYQSANEMHIYSRIFVGERLFLVLGVALSLALGSRDAVTLMTWDVMTKVLGCAAALWVLRKEPRLQDTKDKEYRWAHDVWTTFSGGIFVNMSAWLTVGVTAMSRFGVERGFGIAVFGQMALAFSLIGLFQTLASTVGIAVLPSLRNHPAEERPALYQRVNSMIGPLLGLSLVGVIILAFGLRLWLPDHPELAVYLIALAPVSIGELRSRLLSVPFLQAERKERWIAVVNVIIIALAAAMTIYSVKALGSPLATVITLTISVMLRAVFLAFLADVVMGKKHTYWALWDVIISSVFLIACLTHQDTHMLLWGLGVAVLNAALCGAWMVSTRNGRQRRNFGRSTEDLNGNSGPKTQEAIQAMHPQPQEAQTREAHARETQAKEAHVREAHVREAQAQEAHVRDTQAQGRKSTQAPSEDSRITVDELLSRSTLWAEKQYESRTIAVAQRIRRAAQQLGKPEHNDNDDADTRMTATTAHSMQERVLESWKIHGYWALWSISIIVVIFAALAGWDTATGVRLLTIACVVLTLAALIMGLKHRPYLYPWLVIHFFTYVFVLDRPLLAFWGSVQRDNFAVPSYYQAAALFQAWMFLAGLQVAVGIYRKITPRARDTVFLINKLGHRFPVTQFLITVGLGCASIALAAVSFDAFLFARVHGYAVYYSSFQPRLPGIISYIAIMARPLLLVRLAFVPKVRDAAIAIGMYGIALAPRVVMGRRGDLVSLALLTAFYVFIYVVVARRQRGLAENRFVIRLARHRRAAAAALATVLLFALWVFDRMNYQRFGETVAVQAWYDKFFVTRFLYDQGVTFVVIARGLQYGPYFYGAEEKNYALGSLIDQAKHGSFAQLFFGAKEMGHNNLTVVEYGNSFGDDYGLFFFPKQFLAGRGSGSSIIVEFAVTYGWAGVLLAGVGLGLILIAMTKAWSGSWLGNMLLLVPALEVCFVPRSTSFQFLTLIMSAHFVAVVVIVATLVALESRGAFQRFVHFPLIASQAVDMEHTWNHKGVRFYYSPFGVLSKVVHRKRTRVTLKDSPGLYTTGPHNPEPIGALRQQTGPRSFAPHDTEQANEQSRADGSNN